MLFHFFKRSRCYEKSLSSRFEGWAGLKAVYGFFTNPKVTHQSLQKAPYHVVSGQILRFERDLSIGAWVASRYGCFHRERQSGGPKELEVWLRTLQKLGRLQKNG